MHEFEQIEDAVIAALDPLKSSGLRTLESYAGQLDVEKLDEITLRFPCIYVFAAGLEVTEVNRVDRAAMEVLLFVGDRNFRGNAGARRGDSVSPGVYELLSQSQDRLHRKTMIEGWTALSVRRIEPVAYDRKAGICLYAAGYKMKATI